MGRSRETTGRPRKRIEGDRPHYVEWKAASERPAFHWSTIAPGNKYGHGVASATLLNGVVSIRIPFERVR